MGDTSPFTFRVDIGPDAGGSFGPNPPAVPQPRDQPPVVCQDNSGPKVGKAELGSEGVNFREKLFHDGTIARNRVQVNARNNVSAMQAATCNNQAMQNGWIQRLREVIEGDGRSLSKISEDAGLGRNFVQQMLKDGKAPSVDRLAKVLDAFPKEKAIYVILGEHLSLDDLRMIRLLEKMPEDSRRDVRSIAERLAGLPLSSE